MPRTNRRTPPDAEQVDQMSESFEKSPLFKQEFNSYEEFASAYSKWMNPDGQHSGFVDMSVEDVFRGMISDKKIHIATQKTKKEERSGAKTPKSLRRFKVMKAQDIRIRYSKKYKSHTETGKEYKKGNLPWKKSETLFISSRRSKTDSEVFREYNSFFTEKRSKASIKAKIRRLKQSQG